MNATVVREMPAAGNRNEAAATPPAQPKISIVIPLYNEEESIPHLVEALDAAIAHYGQPAEVIIVDDGSKDRSFALLKEVAERDPRYTIIRFRRNFGQTAAFAAGFAHARGEVVITMDADLQNDPMDIPLLMAKIEEGYDIVSGWRKNRQDRWLDRKLPSMLANRLISNVTDVRLHDYGCSLKAYRTEVLKHVRLYGELHRFIPALASQVGATVTEVPVNHRSRQYGRSKYGISRTIRVMLDLINVWFLGTYSTRPIHVFGTLGLGSIALGVLTGLYLTSLKLFWGASIGNRPLLLLAVLLVVIGVQLVTMGLLAEMITRTYYESQNKPIYVVREIVGRSSQRGEQ
ncbi:MULTISPECIES: glycosyltransferase family 2 protein [Caldilinea]|nr:MULTISPECIES: glycosyltransferase family 2 protein [Caldilinea]MBO9393082.1 glycosyltransferase family 2 protein [Caldilinea sp.]GIV73614.1 MAG: glycosyl transferase [Caldilinea sp.]